MRRLFWIQAVVIAGLAGTAQSQGLEQKPDLSNSSVSITHADHKGRAALRVLDRLDVPVANDLVQLPVGTFKDGVIEADVAGLPAEGAPEGSRGFIGIAFRVQKDPEHYEAFYLRPTNGRSDDQLRRNHATQYIAAPDYPWQRLRKENPGVYESYVDVVPGEWIHIRIEVAGDKARLFVGTADQPVLIVNDLLGSGGGGGVALWVGQGTDGYFSNVKVVPAVK